ncbi:hypothetical protein GUJ93_ZPchr0004g38727 [Zizania palustris]|uniref:Uncharacterized protein n=1 Tax=Zizania palustris TaxID=103762 RepID=A0A8J5SY00_ZIZPA|nr:hypothetical protein GUJ93_ZPchr0004g38727 [Zizania palustris]
MFVVDFYLHLCYNVEYKLKHASYPISSEYRMDLASCLVLNAQVSWIQVYMDFTDLLRRWVSLNPRVAIETEQEAQEVPLDSSKAPLENLFFTASRQQVTFMSNQAI